MKGGSGTGPTKTLDERGVAEGGQRWRFVPLRHRLSSTSARATSLPSVDYSLNLEGVAADDTTFSHFSASLEQQSDENCTATFVNYVTSVKPLSLSLPLVYRNRLKIIDLSLNAIEASVVHSGADAVHSISTCLTALSVDLGPSGFLPHFPRVVAKFAQILKAGHCNRATSASTPGNTAPTETIKSQFSSSRDVSGQGHTLFWNPEDILIPLFASLSELTKLMISHLLQSPTKTIVDLGPLLAHHHYRVREMTGESCLGYLIRKARDPSIRDPFVRAVVRAPLDTDLSSRFPSASIADGLGVALFEGVRLPSGRLHSRGKDVLRMSFYSLSKVHSTASNADGVARAEESLERGNDTDVGLLILSRCFSSLCRHSSNADDMRSITSLFLDEASIAIDANNWKHVGNVLFLTRKWLHYGGQNLNIALGPALCQKMLNITVRSVECPCLDARIVCEALCTLTSLHRYSSEIFREKSVLRAFISALELISKVKDVATLAAALNILLSDHIIKFDASQRRTLARGVSSICDQIVSATSSTPCPPGGKNALIERKTTSLAFALRFLRKSGSIRSSTLPAIKFSAPELEPFIISTMKRIIDTSEASKVSETIDGMFLDDVEPLSLLRSTLEYMSYVKVTGSVSVLQHLYDSGIFRTSDISAFFLSACARQGDGFDGDESTILEIVATLLKNPGPSRKERWGSEIFCSGVSRCIDVFGFDAIFDSQAMREDDSDATLSFVNRTVAENLSSEISELRKSSLALLSKFGVVESPDDIGPTDRRAVDKGVSLQESLQKLRSTFSSALSVRTLSEPLLGVMYVNRDMEGISSCTVLLQELTRLFGIVQAVDTDVVYFLTHFALGMIQTPLKVLWKQAGDLLNALAMRNCNVVISCVVAHLKRCASNLRSQKSCTQNVESDLDTEDSKDVGDREVEQHDVITEEKRATILDDETVSDGSDIKNKTLKLPMKRRQSSHGIVSKRQRAISRESKGLHWDPSEWIGFRDTSATRICLQNVNEFHQPSRSIEGSTDPVTVITELCRALSKNPKTMLNHRSDIIFLYLSLPPTMFSRRGGTFLVSSILSLLERMGGLKCCESDKEKELVMRERLLTDLTRPAPVLQESALRCLCVSRAGYIKQHLDSLLRVLSEKTFREELTLMTENLFKEWGVSNDQECSTDQVEFLDIIVRICFSKTVGGKGSLDSRRSAVFSFFSSKLGSPMFMSRVTSLLIQPIRCQKSELDPVDINSTSRSSELPIRSVQIGILNSIGGFVKFCRRVIPLECWREIGSAILLVFGRAGSGSYGQTIRSTALRLLSSMTSSRPDDTSFITADVLQVAKISIGPNGGKGASSTPALLEYLTSCLTMLPSEQVDALFESHLWMIDYCIEVILFTASDCEAVDLSCDVLQCYLAFVGRKSELSQNDSIEAVLVLKAPDALSQLIARLTSIMAGKFSLQKKWSTVFEKSLDVVKHMIDVWPDSGKTLFQLIEPLVLYLLNESTGRISSPVLSTLCSIATSKFQCSSTNISDSLNISQLLHLLSLRRFTQNNESYTSLCTLIGTIGGDDLAAISSVLQNMKAMSHKRLEEPDLDMRIEALNKVSKMFSDVPGSSDRDSSGIAGDIVIDKDGSVEGSGRLMSLSSNGILALCHGCISSVWTKDTAIRGTAGYCLKLMSRWVGLSNSEAATKSRSDVFNLLLHQVISCKNITHRREFTLALGELVRSCQELTGDEGSRFLHKYLKNVCNSDDLELDFFENLVHLQPHRRSRALRQLERCLQEDDNLIAETNVSHSKGFVVDVFVLPLATNIAFEITHIEPKRHRNAKHISSEDAQKDVASWAVKLVGTAASHTEWPKYKRFLDELLKKLSKQNEADDCFVTYKLLVAVAEAFPKQGEKRYPHANTATEYLVDTLLPNMLLHVSSGAITEDLLHARERPTSRFVEVGNRNDKSQSLFRAPIAIAIGVLLASLPEEKVEAMISLLVTPLTSALRSRMVSTRESAKTALTSVVLSLGPKYLNYILRQVLLALNEGFRRDSCVYVVHSLLQGIRDYRGGKKTDQKQNDFDIAGCLDLVINLILTELKNGASETRRDFEDPNASETRLKLANTRASKAGECAELISELIPFNVCALKLCSAIMEPLTQTLSGKLASRLNELLRRLLNGFSKNSSMSAPDAFKLCYFLTADDDAGQNQVDQLEFGKNCDRNAKHPPLKPFPSTRFGLQILNLVLGKYSDVLTSNSEDAFLLRSMAQPFLPLSVGAMRSGKDNLTLAAFRVLQKLLRLRLSGKEAAAEEMAKVITNVLSEHSGGVGEDYSVTGDLFNTCLRAAAIVFKEIGTSKLVSTSKDRIDTITAISCNCIESGSSECRSAAVTFLRSIVSAKIMLPSVYDAIVKVNRLIIHSQSSSLCKACISVSVLFFVSYPLGDERIRQHLDFFVRNLSYDLPSGRISALETLREIILKVPTPVLEAESEYLFLSLTANIARDSDKTCRALASECVRLIFEQIPTGRKIVDLLKAGVALTGVECAMTSLNAPPVLRGNVDPVVINCGAASLAAAVQSRRLTLLQLKLVLSSTTVAMQNISEDEDWEACYMLFHCIEAIFEQQDGRVTETQRLETANTLCGLWQKMDKFLLHRNQRVRLIASRLIGAHLSACGGRNADPSSNRKDETWFVWICNDTVRDWVKASCLQLEANQLALELGEQCLKNVMCMADVIRKHPLAGDIGVRKDPSTDMTDGGSDLDEPKKFPIETGGEAGMDEGRMLRWTLSRFCGLATKGGRETRDFLRRACALRFLLVTAKWWGKEVVGKFKKHFILPVVLVLESGELLQYEMAKRMKVEPLPRRMNRKVKQEKEGNHSQNENEIGWKSLKVIAEGLQATLSECIGSVEYYEIYHSLQTKRAAAKLERKRKAAVLAAVDPERNAKRKRARVALKRLRKQGLSTASAKTKLATSSTRPTNDVVDDVVDIFAKDRVEKRQLTEDL